MKEFKVGDRVRVTKTPSEEYMFFKVGDTGVVTSESCGFVGDSHYEVQFDEPHTHADGLWCIERGSEIELVKENKVEVGQVYHNSVNDSYYKVAEVTDFGSATFHVYESKSLKGWNQISVWGSGTIEAELEKGYFTLVGTSEELEELEELEVGDVVYLLEGAHGSANAGFPKPEFLLEYLGGDLSGEWVVMESADSDGDVFIHRSDNEADSFFVLKKFLTKVKPEDSEDKNRVNSVNNVSETVEVSKLLEANEFLGGGVDSAVLDKLIALARRLK